MRFQKLLKLTDLLQNHGFVCLCICLFIYPFSGQGQGKNFVVNKTEPTWVKKISPKEKRPADKDISEGYFLAFYENQNHVEREEDYYHMIREIVSDAGVQNGSQITVTYDPGFQQLSFHKVTIWRDGKPYDRLKANSFKLLQSEKELSRFIYSGTFDALMVLDDVRKGDRIEFAYTLKGYNPIYGKKYASTYYFEGASSIGHIYTNVIFNKSRALKFKNFNFNTPPKTTETGQLRMYEWESTLTKTYRTVDFEPNWYNPLKRTQLSEFLSWSDVVDWGLAVNDYPNLKTPLLDKKVTELKAQAGTDLKKYIKLATRFVQDEIRYMGIEIGAYSHRPNSPEKILLQRYGDCKDKSLLLVKLLNANGVNAYMTYANSYGSTYRNDFLPSPFIFNHVIVMVDYKQAKTWIDPTISYQRGNFDDFYAPNYNYVLVVKKGVNALEKIESKPLGKLISNLNFKMADTVSGGKTTLEIYSIYKDNYADDMRAEIAEAGTEDLEKRFLEYFTKMYPDIEIKENMVIEDDEASNTLEIKESYEITDIWTENADSKARMAYFYGDLITSELRTIKSKRRLMPIALKHYINIEQNITVNMPYLLPAHEDMAKVENDNYFFDLYVNQRDSVLKFSYTYKNMTDHIPEDQVKQYIADMKKIDGHLSYTAYREQNGPTGTGVNFYTALPYLLALVVSAFLFSKLYFRKEAFDIEKIAEAIPIGGWLFLVALRLIVFPISLLLKPFALDMFNPQLWKNLSTFTEGENLLKTAFILESIFFATLFAYSVYCLILFFQKRREFPKNFIGLCLAHLGFLIFDLSISAYIEKVDAKYVQPTGELTAAMGATVYSLLFIWYIAKSERVKQTFVFTYPKFAWKAALAEYYEQLSFKKEEPQQMETNGQLAPIEIEDSKPTGEKEI